MRFIIRCDRERQSRGFLPALAILAVFTTGFVLCAPHPQRSFSPQAAQAQAIVVPQLGNRIPVLVSAGQNGRREVSPLTSEVAGETPALPGKLNGRMRALAEEGRTAMSFEANAGQTDRE